MGITLTAIGADVEEKPPRLATSIRAQRTIAQVERDLGGRDVILAELLRAPKLDPAVRQLVELLYDPRFDKQPLPLLCERVGITPGDLFAAFRDATIATAHIHAVRLIASHFPNVVTALVESATNHQETCPSCKGAKTVRVLKPKKDRRVGEDKYDLEPCTNCGETGQVTVRADPDQQERILEVMGLLKKGVGFQLTDNSTTINATQNNLPAPTGTSLFDLQKAVGTVLHRQPLKLVPKPEDEPTRVDPDPSVIVAEVVGE